MTGVEFAEQCPVRVDNNITAVSINGSTLAIGVGKVVQLRHVETGEEIRTLQGHTDNVNSVCFSADGLTLASGSSDKTVRLWSIPDQQDAHDGHCSPSDYEWSSGPYFAGLTAKGCNLQHCAGLGEAKQRLLRYFGATDGNLL
jgi:WD40 repeat protein